MATTALKDALSAAIDGIAEKTPVMGEGDHMNEEGLLVCGTCGQPKQRRVEALGRELVVPVLCSCEQRERDRQDREREDRQRQLLAQEARRKCFETSPPLAACTFESDDGQEAKVSRACERYADTFVRDDTGLVLYGNVGGGKTFMAAAIANRVIDRGFTALQTDIGSIVTLMESSFERRQRHLDRIMAYDLLIIDDLGAQRNTEYVLQHVYSIIDGRYRRGKPMVITTNLDVTDRAAVLRLGEGWARIFDRIIEVCYPIKVSGNRRLTQAKVMRGRMHDRLGL